MSKEEFERYAQEFLRMASQTADPYVREQLIEIAGEWMKLAREQDANDDKPDHDL